MKKIITGIIGIAIVLITAIASIAASYTSTTPSNDSIIDGSASELFSITANETLSNAALLINGVVQFPTLSCGGFQCNQTFNLSSYNEGTVNFSFSTNRGNTPQYQVTINRPILAPTFNPLAPLNSSSSSINITADYSSNNKTIDVGVFSGSVLLQSLQNCTVCSFTTTLPDGIYQFKFNATDGIETRSDDYDVQVSTGNFTMNLSTVSLVHLSANVSSLKSSALANGNDYWLLKIDYDMYPDAFVRVSMGNLIGNSGTILIPEQSSPVLFCYADYNPSTQNIVSSPIYNTYDVKNSMNTSVPALDCPSTSNSSSVYSAILKIHVPVGTTGGSYSSTITHENYATEI